MVVEVLSRLMKKRAGDLEKAIGGLLGEGPKDAEFGSALDLFKGTSVYRSVEQASASSAGKTRMPSYVSAKAFADATVEMLTRYDAKGNTVARKLDELPETLKPLEAVKESMGNPGHPTWLAAETAAYRDTKAARRQTT
jgi:hypothetical protein